MLRCLVKSTLNVEECFGKPTFDVVKWLVKSTLNIEDCFWKPTFDVEENLLLMLKNVLGNLLLMLKKAF